MFKIKHTKNNNKNNNNTHNWYGKGANSFCFKWYVQRSRDCDNNTQGWNVFNVFEI